MKDFKAELAKYGLTEEQYEACLSDIKGKDSGANDLDWAEICTKYNLDIHYDTLRKASQTIFGGVFVSQYLEEKNKTEQDENEDYLEEIKQAKLDLSKERQKIKDERTDYQRALREDARRERFYETLIDKFTATTEPLNYEEKKIFIDSDNDLVVCLSDIHAGMNVRNYWNRYNVDILKERLNKYLDKIIEVQKLHECKVCYLTLGGDEISGIIHTSLRLENNENVIEQLKIVIDLVGDFIDVLHKHFEEVKVFGVAGNHARISPSKEESLKGENLEEMILYCLAIRFKQVESVEICQEAGIDNTLTTFKTRGGKNIYLVHGDRDNMATAAQNLTMVTGVKPDVVLLSHLHHITMDTIQGVKLVRNGSVIGIDDYSADLRIVGDPEQVCFVTNTDNAVECLYNVNLK